MAPQHGHNALDALPEKLIHVRAERRRRRIRLLAALALCGVMSAGAVRWLSFKVSQSGDVTARPADNFKVQAITPSPIVPQGIMWERWLRTSAAATANGRLRAMLSRVITDWTQRGVPSNSFGVLRVGAAPAGVAHDEMSRAHTDSQARSIALSGGCYPFEKQHARGALDLWVGDLNGDARADLVDLCLFARSLDKLQGGCGVYARRFEQHDSVHWVHVDTSGKADRWGEERTSGESTVRPVVWSRRARSPQQRGRAWGLDFKRNPLRVIVEKTPCALVFDGARRTITLHPALRLYAGKWPVKFYAATLGFDPVNDKQKRGDYRTPEGGFYLCGANAESRFHKSLRLSYPNAEDAARGLRDGIINQATHDEIVRAVRSQRMPPQDTALGGDIMLHGGGGAREPWTWGCIALDNDAIDELFELLPPRTSVRVLPAS